ncbi:enoyl-CoA hydratase [Marinobacter nanhaiticus D15-8W]|uniref:enoyl-CoA hydratase-related protein n=1 Tax=Marinobacter nanhaiticus TaxID=1305740 RepID=UPI0002CC2A73|nr:enoyl-CoA hydratase-related protein [Marinobacter nanhaiticus]BES71718.1 enoyl-CoA hydratase [Marinobacter nanhaiticus D15-8W]
MVDTTSTQPDVQNGLAMLSIPQSAERYWTEGALADFLQTVQALGLDPAVRALILTGEPGQPFSHGLELTAVREGSKVASAGIGRQFAQAFAALRRFPGVSVAALTGNASDAGLECALCCDFRIAEPGSQFSMVPARYGLVPVAGGSQLLPRLVGEVWAKRLLLCGETVDAEQALAIGLVDAVSESGGAVELAADWARRSFAQGPTAIRATKQLIEHARMRPLETGFAAERDWLVELQGTAEQIEGVRAGVEGRQPHWQDDSGIQE